MIEKRKIVPFPFAVELAYENMPFDSHGVHATGREICTGVGGKCCEGYEDHYTKGELELEGCLLSFIEYEDNECDEIPTLFYEMGDCYDDYELVTIDYNYKWAETCSTGAVVEAI